MNTIVQSTCAQSFTPIAYHLAQQGYHPRVTACATYNEGLALLDSQRAAMSPSPSVAVHSDILLRNQAVLVQWAHPIHDSVIEGWLPSPIFRSIQSIQSDEAVSSTIHQISLMSDDHMSQPLSLTSSLHPDFYTYQVASRYL